MDVPSVGDYVVIVQWGGGMRHVKYVGPVESKAYSVLAAVRMDRERRTSRKKRGARPRAFLAKIEVEG